MTEQKKLLIIGGRGALGQKLVQHFKEKKFWIANVDHGVNEAADINITINSAELESCLQQAEWIERNLKEKLKIEGVGSLKVLDGIICVAGGWTGGNILSDGFLTSVDLMWKQSVHSSVVAAYLGGKFLKDKGLLVMTGAQAALDATPSMIGYGIAKAAVHHLIKSLAAEGSGLPKNAVIVGLLPRTLDTPNNRKFSSESTDFGTWTPLNHVSGIIDGWMEPSESCNTIRSGALAEIITIDGKTRIEIH